MATIFPADPEINDEYQGYRYNGTSWDIIGVNLTADYPEITGGYISDTVIPATIARVDDVTTSLGDYIPLDTKGEPLGVAELDASGYVPSSQLNINLSGYATETYVGTAISNLVDASPTTLNTLNELAAALGDDPNFATTISTALGNKQDVVSGVSSTEIGYLDGVTSEIQSQLNAKSPIASPTFTGTATIPTLSLTNALSLANGGTGSTTRSAAITNLQGYGVYSSSTTLTNTSPQTIFASPSSGGITLTLPNVTTLALGWSFNIKHTEATRTVTINTSSGSFVASLEGGMSVRLVCVNTNSSAATSWDLVFNGSDGVTGTGNLVLSTSPFISTAINTSSTSFNLINTTATTMNAFGAATTLNIGTTSTAAKTMNLFTAATISGSTKTLNIGTGGASGSTTAINIGSSVSGATNNITLNGITSFTPATQTGFRNVLINGDFRINQRGFTSKGAGATVDYGFDRWFIYSSEGNATITPQTFALGNVIPGYESSNFLRLTTPSTTKVGAYDLIGQRIEDVRTLAGQTVTISFWAKAGSGTPSISLELTQNFGTGGSPSADVNTYVNKIALSTSWTRYSMTISVPSISGKTIGTTANTSYLELDIWGSAGSNFNSRTNSLGNQNNTFDFWGVQVEAGSTATPFEQRPIGTEISLCQRYFQKSFPIATTPTSPGGTGPGTGNNLTVFNQTLGNAYSSLIRFQTPMRRSPDVTLFNSETANAGTWSVYNSAGAANSSLAVSADSHHNGIMVQIPGVPSITVANGAWTASAEL